MKTFQVFFKNGQVIQIRAETFDAGQSHDSRIEFKGADVYLLKSEVLCVVAAESLVSDSTSEAA